MNDNDFDKAGRSCLHLDPSGFLHWLLPELAPTCTFQRWADTRTIAFPGEPDRTCDTVAELLQTGQSPRWWLLVLELQSMLDKEIFGRLLEYLGRAWSGLHPLHQRKERYHLAAVLINFRGRGHNSRDFRLPGTAARTCLQIVEKNVAAEDAAETLARIASGEWTRALLPMIPLMQGGKEARIIEQWKTVAASEPDERLRGEYGSLARVFADLAKRGRIWRQALEGWNMKRSESVMEWQAEAREEAQIQTRIEALLEVLRSRFGSELPTDLVQRIQSTADVDQLKHWLETAARARSLKKFRQAMDA